MTRTLFRSLALGLVVAALAAAPALASSCPKHMKAIDEAMMSMPKLAAADLDKAKMLRAEGETLHKAGKHDESMEKLMMAEKMLGIPTTR
jgi:hypothetical protein